VRLKTKGLMILFLGAFVAAGCGPGADEQLKPPGVRIYRPPQVWVTHAAPTAVATELAEANPSATAAPAAAQPQAGPTLDEEQYLMDEIEYLLNKIESKLDRTDVNP
jgi:hypothetical protein